MLTIHKNRFLPFFASTASAVILALTGCGAPNDPVVSGSNLSGYPAMGSLWQTMPITVCFENPTNANAAERGWIQNRVTQEITGRTNVYFQGWGACTNVGSPASLIRVQLDNSWPHTKGLGRHLHNVTNGMVLATHFGSIMDADGNQGFPGCDANDTARQDCIERIAVHEFGHAIGMAHEQNRPDTPDPSCRERAQGDNGSEVVGYFDNESIMSYCNPAWNNNGRLSIKDVHTIYHMYPDTSLQSRATGEIIAKLIRLEQQSRQVVGEPTGSVQMTPDRYGWFQPYQGGIMYWVPERPAYIVYGLILRKYAELGYERGYGYPLTDELSTPNGRGRYNHFEGGSIYWSPATGAHTVYGLIRNRWAEQGWENGPLGFPTTDESGTPDGIGRYNHFEGGSIYWTPATGAQIVKGKIRDKWAELGWERGRLGYPIGEQRLDFRQGVHVQSFQGGVIRYRAIPETVSVIYN